MSADDLIVKTTDVLVEKSYAPVANAPVAIMPSELTFLVVGK